MKNCLLLFPILLGFYLLSCSSGEIPSPTEPLVELHANYVEERPVLDGEGDDIVWQKANPFIVHVTREDESGTAEFNIKFRAVWWKEWAQGRVDWEERAYLALLITWPDDDKNIEKQQWQYDPQDSLWTRSTEQSDWCLLEWYGLSEYVDIWFWDAALTNPMAYAEDEYLLVSDIDDTTQSVSLWIDGLNYYNDTAEAQNTWDLNYDDNLTPRDSTDDRPLYAWKSDVSVTPPSRPRILTDEEEIYQLLLKKDADFLDKTPYAAPRDEVKIPGYVLEEPKNEPADIMAAGKWKDGEWTVEIVRVAVTSESRDISFSVDDRYFTQVIYVAVGDNVKTPLESLSGDSFFLGRESVQLDFEFLTPRQN
jgi:hypothetical protein